MTGKEKSPAGCWTSAQIQDKLWQERNYALYILRGYLPACGAMFLRSPLPDIVCLASAARRIRKEPNGVL